MERMDVQVLIQAVTLLLDQPMLKERNDPHYDASLLWARNVMYKKLWSFVHLNHIQLHRLHIVDRDL